MIAWAPEPGRRVVFLRDLTLLAAIGNNPDELGRRQRVRVNVALMVREEHGPHGDRLATVVDYARLHDAVRATCAGDHVRLVETLAERVAAASRFDQRIERVRVRIEKLDVFADAESVGVEIERSPIDLSTAED